MNNSLAVLDGNRWLTSLHTHNVESAEYWMFIRSAEHAIQSLLAEVARLQAENAALNGIIDMAEKHFNVQLRDGELTDELPF